MRGLPFAATCTTHDPDVEKWADVDSRLSDLAGVVAGGVVGEHDALDLRNHLVSDAGDSGRHDVEVMSATPGGFAALRPEVRGRPLAAFDQETGHRVVLLGRRVADDIGGAFPAGRTVFIDGLAFTVIGVIDDVVRVHDVLPGAAAQVGAQAPAAIAPGVPERYLVALPPEPASLRLDVQEELVSLVLAVALIVAAVAGIGIANSTLVGVIARTPELGLKRAIGAWPSHLYRLVVTESVLLGAIGGVAGTFVGLMGTMAVIIANGWLPVVDVRTLVMGPLIGVAIGALAGCWPAWRAARIEPTAALRH